MKLSVKLFGPLRPYAPGPGIDLDLPDGARVGDAREAIIAALEKTAPGPAARALVTRSALATEDEVLPDDALLPADARSLAILPPVCGG
jgi:molybdopterin converting factor small subunit